MTYPRLWMPTPGSYTGEPSTTGGKLPSLGEPGESLAGAALEAVYV